MPTPSSLWSASSTLCATPVITGLSSPSTTQSSSTTQHAHRHRKLNMGGAASFKGRPHPLNIKYCRVEQKDLMYVLFMLDAYRNRAALLQMLISCVNTKAIELHLLLRNTLHQLNRVYKLLEETHSKKNILFCFVQGSTEWSLYLICFPNVSLLCLT